jgi:Domain of unknown function (DUF4148)
MNPLVQAAVIASALAVPAISFAQSDAAQPSAPVTRAQVEADLAQFKQYAARSAFGHDPYYPAATQAAEARIASANGKAASIGGISNDGSSTAGNPTPATGLKSTYSGK